MMRGSILIATFTLAIILCVSSDKILVISFYSSKSHKLTYFRLLEELAKRGHEITIVSCIKPFKEVKNIKEIFTFDVEEIELFKTFNAFDIKESGKNINPFI